MAKKNRIEKQIQLIVGHHLDKQIKKQKAESKLREIFERAERDIQAVIEEFEIETGYKVLNKDDLFLKLEKVK